MRVITAPEPIDRIMRNNVSIFLAGVWAITNCQDWRKSVISQLNKIYKDNDRVVILNPRREGFDVFDDAETFKQINWEFNAIKECNIFGVLFCDSKSVQPITMYELGKQLSYCNFVFGNPEKIMRIAIGVEQEYLRKADVTIQASLMGYPVDILRGTKEQRYEDFTNKIIFRINSLTRKS